MINTSDSSIFSCNKQRSSLLTHSVLKKHCEHPIQGAILKSCGKAYSTSNFSLSNLSVIRFANPAVFPFFCLLPIKTNIFFISFSPFLFTYSFPAAKCCLCCAQRTDTSKQLHRFHRIHPYSQYLQLCLSCIPHRVSACTCQTYIS